MNTDLTHPMTPDLITFDCYGTLIDWETGALEALRSVEPGDSGLPDRELLSAFHDIQNEIEAGEWRPYRDVLRETVRGIAGRFGWELAPEELAVLADTLPSWLPFADTNPALERLADAGFRLGIVSNIDDDLLAATMEHFTVRFDVTVTTEDVRSYKPEPEHFNRILEEVGDDPARLLHVARSFYHDVRAARPLDIPTVWVNRGGNAKPDGPEPTAEVHDLEEAVAWIGRRTER